MGLADVVFNFMSFFSREKKYQNQQAKSEIPQPTKFMKTEEIDSSKLSYTITSLSCEAYHCYATSINSVRIYTLGGSSLARGMLKF